MAESNIYSSPIQDPTTSVQAIDAIHDVPRRLVVRDLASGLHCDPDGHRTT